MKAMMIEPGGSRHFLPVEKLKGQENFSERELLMKVIFRLAVFQMSATSKWHGCYVICTRRSLSWVGGKH